MTKDDKGDASLFLQYTDTVLGPFEWYRTWRGGEWTPESSWDGAFRVERVWTRTAKRDRPQTKA